MKRIDRLLQRIPELLSSKGSIFIYLFLFFYLVIYALLCLVIPALSPLAPKEDAQLILGNYTNVLSALGASIAAGAGVHTHQKVTALHRRHDELEKSLAAVHEKLEKIEGLVAVSKNDPEKSK